MKETKLSTVIDVISMGPFGSDIKVDNFISQGIPVLNGSNLTSHKLVENSFKYVSLEKANKLGKANAFRGDIIITHRGTLGQVAYIPQNSKYERYVISQSQFRVRFNDDLDPVYFSYLMKSEYGQKKLLSFKSHVGVPALAQATSNFKRLELKLHNNIDQKKIAAILSALDDKIELNNQINTELEAMAKTLYDYWFVQFDFPDENGKPYQSSDGKMVFNGTLKREIPVGWEVKKLEELVREINTGLNPRTHFKLGEGDNFYITIRNVEYGILNFTDSCDRISDVSLQRIQKRSRLEKGDILFTSIEPVGKTYLLREKPINWNINESVFSIKPNYELVTSEFLFMLLSSFEMKLKCKNSSTGSIHKGIRINPLKEFCFSYAGVEIQKSFSDKIKPILDRIDLNQKQNQELAQLRDWLLPMLMNGQVRVGECDEEDLGLVAEEKGEYKKSRL